MLSAGQRDRLVTIQQRPAIDVAGASGRPVETWTKLGDEWMSRHDVSGGERFVAGANQESAFSTVTFGMIYRADMDPETVNVPKLRRLVFQGRTYDITAATIVGNRRGIELTTIAAL
jgi:SPP1 family predicted phage head-tail adaptor